MTTTYLTVAIPYVNAEPHLGYAYELVLADVQARASRLDGVETRFLGGTDDYSLKNVIAAEDSGIPLRDFVDCHARQFESLRGPLDLSFDDFIRTSADPRHIPAVHRLWNAAVENEDLYRQSYEGDYCVGCERFFAVEELDDGRCPEHQRPVEHIAEENWFFRLSRYQARIEDLIVSEQSASHRHPFATRCWRSCGLLGRRGQGRRRRFECLGGVAGVGSMVTLGQGRLDLAALHLYATRTRRTRWRGAVSASAGGLNQVSGHATNVGAI